MDINKSSDHWEIDQNGKTLIQPLTSIKGLGEIAYKEISLNRPFQTIEELLFHPNIKYNKLNKKALDVMCRTGVLNNLMDERFSGRKHFWLSFCLDRPKTLKKFQENIELYKNEGDFSEDDIIEFETSLAGNYPLDKVIKESTIEELAFKNIPPISEFEQNRELLFCWFIVRQMEIKKTKHRKRIFGYRNC